MPSRGVRSPFGPVSKIRYISHWPLMDHRMDRLQNGTLCTDDDILIELIFCIYIFPETLGFWRRQVHWKPLLTRGNLYPLKPMRPFDPWTLEPCNLWDHWAASIRNTHVNIKTLETMWPCDPWTLEPWTFDTWRPRTLALAPYDLWDLLRPSTY